MGEIDNDEVERLLEDMRCQSTYAAIEAVRGVWNRERKARHPDMEVLEAVARDASLFRAVELRRAEILRGQGFPGGKAGE